MRSMRWTRPFVGFAVLAAACGWLMAAQPAAAQEVKLNEVLRSLFYAPQYVALRSGAFEQEGLKIAGPKTTWGVQAAVTEVVSGNSNIALMGPEAAGLTQDASPDRRLVNFALLTNGDGGFILSKTAMPNFTIADLKGKTIVTSGKGSTPALVLVDLIKKAGLDPNKDVTIRNIPVSANIIPSYLEPSTNFAQAFEPMVVQAVAENRGYRVASVGALAGPMPYTAFMAPASYIEKNPASHPGLHQRGLQGADLDRYAFAGGDRRADRAGFQGRPGRHGRSRDRRVQEGQDLGAGSAAASGGHGPDDGSHGRRGSL